MKIRNMIAVCVMCILLAGCRTPDNEQISTDNTSAVEGSFESEWAATTDTTTDVSELDVTVEPETTETEVAPETIETAPEETTTETLGQETEPLDETTDMTDTGITPPEEENPGESTSGGSNRLPGERE